VRTPSELWPLLHKVALAIEKEGVDVESRAAALVEQMNAMPRGIINAHVANLEMIRAAIDELLKQAKTE